MFQWVESLDKWGCAVCFNISELEEEVLKALLVCHEPTVLVVTNRKGALTIDEEALKGSEF